jgi:non-ribosomal peptide synthase protein (TIGR01720 family)
MQMLARCRKEGINLTLNQVLRSKSITHLANSLGAGSGPFNQDVEKTDKPFDLSPIQQFYFKSIGDEKRSHFNQSFTFRLTRRVLPEQLKKVMDAIAKCHSMLRARFVKDSASVWQQTIPSNAEGAYQFQVHQVTAKSDLVRIIANTQKHLDIVNGPVFAVNLFEDRSGEQTLFLGAHHLVIDIVSWRVILGDLEECLASGSTAGLQKELPFQVWCDQQTTHAQQPAQVKKLMGRSFNVQPADLAFWGLSKDENVYEYAERDSFSMSQDVSALALNNHHALRTDVVDLFVAAIVHSFSRIFINRTTPTVFNETHGREIWDGSNLDLSRTVGWFTTMYPVHVPIAENEDDVVNTVRQIKDQRRAIADNGRPYFAHRFLTEDGKQRFADHEPVEVLFNFLGKTQHGDDANALLQSVQFAERDEHAISDVGPTTTRLALFEISASVNQGKIEFTFMYNRLMKNQKGIRRWILEYQRTLEEIVHTLAKIETPRPTLSDFPLLPLESYERLDRVLKTLPAAGVASYGQVEDIYPCASMQVGMILSQIKNPESYLSFSAFEVKVAHGEVNLQRLAEAWQKVVNRHPALRTVFVDSVCKGGVFDQVVLKEPDCGVITYTCRDSDLSDKLASIKYSKLNGKKKPRLAHQFSIVKTLSGRVIVKMEINHTVIDGGSHGVIRQDLLDAYQGRLTDDEGPLYSDYVKYMRSLPEEEAVDYWKSKLRRVQPCYFPLIPQHSTKNRQLRSLYMKFDRWTALQTLAEKSSVTFSNIMLAVWALVLRKYTDSSDVCYGYLTSGRNVPIDNIENAVGAFINMLVSRITVSHNQPLLEVFQTVQDNFIESLPYQHTSMAQFQHALGLSGKPLFNTALSVQNTGATEGQVAPESNVQFESLDSQDPSEFVISVNIDASRNDEGVRFAYWTDHVSDEAMNKVSSLMARILVQILNDPGQTVGELDDAIADKSNKRLKVPSPPLLRRMSSSRSTSRIDLGNSMRSLNSTPRFEMPDPMAALPSPRSYRTNQSPRFEIPDPMNSIPTIPEGRLPKAEGNPDWGNLIRSIVSEMVPQIVDQMLSKNKNAPQPGPTTMNDMTNQMVGMLQRRRSISIHGKPDFDTRSIRTRQDFDTRSFLSRGDIDSRSVRTRRMSVASRASDAESRINIAADMVAAAGVMASEALKGVSPDFVEKKLLTLWSELLDMVEESIDTDDSFFVSVRERQLVHRANTEQQLGGDSIIAMRLVGAAREEGLSMTVADVFKNPTFADMARVCFRRGDRREYANIIRSFVSPVKSLTKSCPRLVETLLRSPRVPSLLVLRSCPIFANGRSPPGRTSSPSHLSMPSQTISRTIVR